MVENQQQMEILFFCNPILKMLRNENQLDN